MFVEPTSRPKTNPKENNSTMDDMHAELSSKFNSPNRGLTSENARAIPDSQSTTIPLWKQIFLEFKGKLATKNNANQ